MMVGERYVVLDASGRPQEMWRPVTPSWRSPMRRDVAVQAVMRLGQMMPVELETLAATPDTGWWSGWLASAARLEVRRRIELDES